MSSFNSAHFIVSGSWPVPAGVTDVIVTMAGGGAGAPYGVFAGAGSVQITSHLKIPSGTTSLQVNPGAGGMGGAKFNELGTSGQSSQILSASTVLLSSPGAFAAYAVGMDIYPSTNFQNNSPYTLGPGTGGNGAPSLDGTRNIPDTYAGGVGGTTLTDNSTYYYQGGAGGGAGPAGQGGNGGNASMSLTGSAGQSASVGSGAGGGAGGYGSGGEYGSDCAGISGNGGSGFVTIVW